MCFAPQRRALFRHFFDIWTSKSGPNMVCFVHFDFKMCFAPQRRALFRHRNFQKWSDHGVLCTFWLQNVLRATTACTFSTSQLPKVVRSSSALSILTWKCASRRNGVHFFMSHLASWLRTRRFSEPTFRPSGATNHWKNTVNRDFPIFLPIYLFFLLIFSLLTLFTSAFQLSILSEVSLLNFLRSLHWSFILSCFIMFFVIFIFWSFSLSFSFSFFIFSCVFSFFVFSFIFHVFFVFHVFLIFSFFSFYSCFSAVFISFKSFSHSFATICFIWCFTYPSSAACIIIFALMFLICTYAWHFPPNPPNITHQTMGNEKKWRSDHSLKTTLKKMKKWKKNEKMKKMKNEKKLENFCFFGCFWFFSRITSKAPHFDLPGAPFWPSLALALVWPCSSFWPPWGSLLAFRSLAMPASRTQNGKHRSKSGRTSLEPLGLGIVCG